MKKIFITISLLFSLTLTSANSVEVTIEAKITGLYVAFFNRAADQAGLEYWTNTADNVANQGGDVSSVFKTLSGGFATHPTFTLTYEHLEDKAFVEAIYRNALGRDGDAEGIAYWTDLIERGMSRSNMVATFVELSLVTNLTKENYPSLSDTELAAAQLRQDLITNKVSVAVTFTNQLGTLSNVENGDEPESDPAYLASIKIISEVTEDAKTVSSVLGFLEGIVGNDDPVWQINEADNIGDNNKILKELIIGKTFYSKSINYLRIDSYSDDGNLYSYVEGMDSTRLTGSYSFINGTMITKWDNGYTSEFKLYSANSEFIQFYENGTLGFKYYYERKIPDNAITEEQGSYSLLAGKTFYQYCKIDGTWNFTPLVFNEDKNLILGEDTAKTSRHYRMSLAIGFDIENNVSTDGYDHYSYQGTHNEVPIFDDGNHSVVLLPEEHYIYYVNQGSGLINSKYGATFCGEGCYQPSRPSGMMFAAVFTEEDNHLFATKETCNSSFYYNKLREMGIDPETDSVADETLLWSDCGGDCFIYYNGANNQVPSLPIF